MEPGTRAWDVGMVCGELMHAFLWRSGDAWAAEPFIRVFLEAYTGAFPERERTFGALTRRQFGLFPDAAATQRRLREHYALGLVSDAQWVFTEPELALTGLRDLCCAPRGRMSNCVRTPQ